MLRVVNVVSLPFKGNLFIELKIGIDERRKSEFNFFKCGLLRKDRRNVLINVWKQHEKRFNNRQLR